VALAAFLLVCHSSALPAREGPIQVILTNGSQGPLAQVPVYVTVTGVDGAGRFLHLDSSGQFLPCLASDNAVPRDGTTWCAYSQPLVSPALPMDPGPGVAGGRLYLSIGAPLLLRVEPATGALVQPDPANPTDPNAAILFDWVEFTLDATGFHGNTTCVDQFALPITLEALDGAGGSTGQVGLLERRTDLLRSYLAEVPPAFGALADPRGLRILAPGHAPPGPLRAWLAPYLQEQWERYRTEPLVLTPDEGTFTGWVQPGGQLTFTRPGDPETYSIQAMPTTLETFRCDGVLAQGSPLDKVLGAQVGALLNRHLLERPLDWRSAGFFYQAGPCNAYAAFWHRHGLDHLAYGFPYDDVAGQATLVHLANPAQLRIGFRVD
jgi:hypothetical protein